MEIGPPWQSRMTSFLTERAASAMASISPTQSSSDLAEVAPIEPPVVPLALTNLWGSFFSRIEQGGAMVRPFRRGLFNRVGLNVGAPMAPAQVEPGALRQRVATLLAS